MHTVTHARPMGTARSPSAGPAGRSGPARALGWSAVFASAVVLTAIGVGVGVPHLRKEGPGLATVLGLTMVAAGLVLTLWSAGRLLAGVRRRWWLVVIPLMLLTTYLGVWTVGQGVAAGLPARPVLGASTPADVGLGYRAVTLTTADGVALAAWWVPSRNGAAVALLHGAGSTRTAVLDHAAVLADAGYGVLLVDARGHGESGGRAMGFGWFGETDADAAVDFLADRPDVSPRRIGLVGLSMGGETAIGAAGADPRVRAVVAEGATNRVAADKGYLGVGYGVRGELQQGVDRLTYAVAGLLSSAPTPTPLRDAVRATAADGSDTPVLLVAAGEVETEQLAADYVRDAAPDVVQTWTVPGADHTRGLSAEPAQWTQRVTRFLDAALRGES